MSAKRYFLINEPTVVYETISSEIVALNFSNGCYYSLKGSEFVIWQGIANGLGSDFELANLLSKTYGLKISDIDTDVTSFLDKLLEEGLVKSVDVDQMPNLEFFPQLETNDDSYSPPQLNIFNDMQQTILLDPIHDVDQRGWPNPKA